MNSKSKTACRALCSAFAMFCLAGCPATDPAVVYNRAYASSYNMCIANGWDPKAAEVEARSAAEYERDLVVNPNHDGGPPEAGYILARVMERDEMTVRTAAIQAGTTRVPAAAAATSAVNATTICPPVHKH